MKSRNKILLENRNGKKNKIQEGDITHTFVNQEDL